MVKLQLVEIYAMSWRKRDVSILAPYLTIVSRTLLLGFTRALIVKAILII